MRELCAGRGPSAAGQSPFNLLVSNPATGEALAVEVKYRTASWTGTINGEEFRLLNQGAQDIRAYDVVKDIHRVERFIREQAKHGRCRRRALERPVVLTET